MTPPTPGATPIFIKDSFSARPRGQGPALFRRWRRRRQSTKCALIGGAAGPNRRARRLGGQIGLLGVLAAWLTPCVAALGGQNVSLAWDVNTNASTAGYAVYVGSASGVYTNRIDAGTNTAITLTGLQEGLTYYFAATDYNSARVESPLSAQVSFLVPGMMKMTGGSGGANPLKLAFPVAVGHWYQVQASTNLKTWTNIYQTTSSTSNAWLTYQDPQSGSFSKRFYRLIMH